MVFYRSKSAYTSNKISNRSDVQAVTLSDQFSTTTKQHRVWTACLCVCVLHREGSRVVASNAVSMNHFCHIIDVTLV